MWDLFNKKNSKEVLENEIGWNFPSNNGGELKGLQDAGTETFKGSVFSSLAREICQNSLDARLDATKPVKVVFELSEIDRNEIPGIDELSMAMNCCKDFFSEVKKTTDFFENANQVITNDTIRVLRVGDYNTTGIYGADKTDYASCPWQDLVKSSGVSNKGGTSGGSFGIGKYAPYACSDIRTIVYSTLDKNGVNAYQGVANLVSFKYPYDVPEFNIKEGDISQGKGYYGRVQGNNAILDTFKLNGYQRTETGTDLFILGFMQRNGWQEEVIKYIIEEYLISILNNHIEVEVDGMVINRLTLDSMMQKYFKEDSLTYNYYQVLTREDAVVKYIQFHDLGEIELRILIEKGFNRKVLMARNTGMKIFDLNRISGSIPFAGICILKDEKVNSYFREMENPQHTKWEADRHHNSKEADKYRKDLSRLIKDEVNALGRETTLAEMDAIGVGDFLPDLMTNINGQDSDKENIGNDIKEFTAITKKEIKKDMSSAASFERVFESDYEADVSERASVTEDGNTEVGGQTFSDGGEVSGGQFGGSTGAKGLNDPDGDTSTSQKETIKPLKTRIIYDEAKKSYRMMFTVSSSANNVDIEVVGLGEQGNSKMIITEALLNGETPLDLKKGHIIIPTVQANKKYNIQYKIKQTEICCMGVKLNGHQV